MDEMKHTPGPWTPQIGVSRHGGRWLKGIAAPNGENVRLAGFTLSTGRDIDEDEPAANSFLVTTAVNAYPEMLEALEQASEFMQRFVVDSADPPSLLLPDGEDDANNFTSAWDETMRSIRAAISKATES